MQNIKLNKDTQLNLKDLIFREFIDHNPSSLINSELGKNLEKRIKLALEKPIGAFLVNTVIISGRNSFWYVMNCSLNNKKYYGRYKVK